MPIIFPELSKTTIHVGIGGDKWVEVPMLTVAEYNEFQRITTDLAKFGEKKDVATSDRIEAIIAAHDKLAEMACRVMPVELADRVRMMDFKQLSELVTALCTGKDNSEGDDPEKKVVLPSQQKT